ncbi:MAG: DUF928 domain-containing protein [Deltaproteobacteria bacterium]|nr:DUF928 domain-containing protein [Deltaproteobacteria bacterium]
MVRAPRPVISTPKLAFVLLLLLSLAGSAQAQTPAVRDEAPAIQVAAATQLAGDQPASAQAKPQPVDPGKDPARVVYEPPRRGSPRAKVGGGLRSAPAPAVPLALAPSHLAETVSARPSLFFYLDGAAPEDATLVFTLIDDVHIDPLAEVQITSPLRAGIQRIDLDRLDISLAPDVEYEWSVSLVANPRSRSQDRISTGYIRRVGVPADLSRDTASMQTYAARGYWYDALESISDAIDAAPADQRLRSQRNALLRQGDLEPALE